MAPHDLSIRPLQPSDRAHVVELLESLSPEDRYARFLRPMPRFSEAIIDRLTAVDGVDHFALAAFDGERCVGISRYVRDFRNAGAADIAVSVAPSHRRRGLARHLLDGLVEPAAAAGIQHLEFTALAMNRAAISLVRKMGATIEISFGTATGIIELASVDRNAA